MCINVNLICLDHRHDPSAPNHYNLPVCCSLVVNKFSNSYRTGDGLNGKINCFLQQLNLKYSKKTIEKIVERDSHFEVFFRKVNRN
jgi:hypothetical protein